MNQKRKKWLALFLSLLLLVCGSVFTGWGGASDLYDRDLLCDGSGSHGRVKGNQKRVCPGGWTDPKKDNGLIYHRGECL